MEKRRGEVIVYLNESYTYHIGGPRSGEHLDFAGTRDDKNPDESGRLLEKITKIATRNHGKIDRHRKEHPLGWQHFDGGTTYNVVKEIALFFGSTGVGLAFLKMVHSFLLAWLNNMSGRSITIKKGDLEITIKGDKDVERAMSALRKLESQKIKGKRRK